jgi:octaprenyl-diphosphate synthase
MAWCARVGGVLSEPFDHALSRYGRALGRAFQVVDDILDCTIDEATTGKSSGRDLQEGKLTLPILLACESNPELRLRIREGLGEQGIPADKAHAILAVAGATGGIERARKRALAFAEEAASELVALPNSPYRDALVELTRLSVDRVA